MNESVYQKRQKSSRSDLMKLLNALLENNKSLGRPVKIPRT